MKMRDLLFAVVLGLGIPCLMYAVIEGKMVSNLPDQNLAVVTEQPFQAETQPTQPAQHLPVLMPDGTQMQMELEEYVTCAVLGEMPADFEIEALKAQAVVARTYALKGNGWKHNNPDHPGRW